MFFEKTDNWKEFLSAEDERKLNDVLEKAAKHRQAYKIADDVKIAQLWCALVELKKENIELHNRLRRIEFMLNGMIERAELGKKELLVESLENF